MSGKAVDRCNDVLSHLQKPTGNTITLCFLDAFNAHKSDRISWDEYLRHLLILLTGVKHKEDYTPYVLYNALHKADPFGYGIYCWNQHLEQAVNDIGPVEAVLQAYRRGSVHETQGRLAALDDGHLLFMRKSVVLLALQERRPKMLEMILNERGGFPYEFYFIEEADRVEEDQDPETFRVLEQSILRKHDPRLRPGCGTDDETAATFDRGGKLPVNW